MKKNTAINSGWNWPALLGWLVFAALLFGLDQWTKDWVQHQMIVGDSRKITDFFNLVVAYNSGAAFSFLADAGGWQKPFCRTRTRRQLCYLYSDRKKKPRKTALPRTLACYVRRACECLRPTHDRSRR